MAILRWAQPLPPQQPFHINPTPSVHQSGLLQEIISFPALPSIALILFYYGSLPSDLIDLDKQQVPEEDVHDDKNAAI